MSATFRRAWLVPTGLIALALIPVLAGGMRLAMLASGAAVTPANARFVSAPLPGILHILGATLYSLLGALQFSPGFRARWPTWHRQAGRVLLVAGLLAASSGLWMALFYDIVPADGAVLRGFRLVFGSVLIFSIIRGVLAVRRGDITGHQAWMRRAYAIAMGAGTQALTQLPLMLLLGELSQPTRTVMMGSAWVLNLVVAEWLIRRARRASQPMMAGLYP